MNREKILHETLVLATWLHGTADRLMRAAEDGNLDAIASTTLPAGLGKIHSAISDITRREKIRRAITAGAQMADDAGIKISERSLLIRFIVDAIEADEPATVPSKSMRIRPVRDPNFQHGRKWWDLEGKADR